jgi:hypothetical protein
MIGNGSRKGGGKTEKCVSKEKQRKTNDKTWFSRTEIENSRNKYTSKIACNNCNNSSLILTLIMLSKIRLKDEESAAT